MHEMKVSTRAGSNKHSACIRCQPHVHTYHMSYSCCIP